MSHNFFKIDMHVHTKYSEDSKLELIDIIKICKKKGIDGVAITDHNSIKGGVETNKIKSDIKVITGAEIKTDYGEVIGYKLTDEIKSRTIDDVIDEIKDQGGYVSVPHPFDRIRKDSIDENKLNEIVRRLDFIEGVNARSFWFFNNKAIKFAEKNGIPIIGGSDAHMKFEVGGCFTVLKDLEKMEIDSIESNVSWFYPVYPLLRTKIYKIFKF